MGADRMLVFRLVAVLAVLASILIATILVATSDPHGLQGAPAITRFDVPRLEPLYGAANIPREHLDWSPDGRWIAAGGDGNREYEALILDARSGSFVSALTPSHNQTAENTLLPGGVRAVRWSPSGRYLAVGASTGWGGGGWVHLYSPSGEHEGSWPVSISSYYMDIAWSPDEARLITVGPGELAVWDVRTRGRLLHETYVSAESVDWSPDGTVWAIGNSSAVKIRNTTTGAIEFEIPTGGGAAWSHDGGRLAIARENGCATVYRRDGTFLWQADAGFACRTWFWAVRPSWSPSDGILALSTDHGIALFNAATGGLLRVLGFPVDQGNRGAASYVDFAVAWSPTGEALATTGTLSVPSLQVWGVRRSNLIAALSVGFDASVLIGLPLALYRGPRLWLPDPRRQSVAMPTSSVGGLLFLGTFVLAILGGLQYEILHRTYDGFTMPSGQWFLATAVLSSIVGAFGAVVLILAFEAGTGPYPVSRTDRPGPLQFMIFVLFIAALSAILSYQWWVVPPTFRSDAPNIIGFAVFVAAIIYIARRYTGPRPEKRMGPSLLARLRKTGGILGPVLLPIVWLFALGSLAGSLLLISGADLTLELRGVLLGVSGGAGLFVASRYASVLRVSSRRLAAALFAGTLVSFFAALGFTAGLVYLGLPLPITLYGPEVFLHGLTVVYGFGLAPFLFGLIALTVAGATGGLGLALPKGAAALYTRLTREKIADLDARKQILAYLKAHPGVHYRELLRALKMGSGALHYHLRVLERAGMIVPQRVGMYRRYFPRGGAF